MASAEGMAAVPEVTGGAGPSSPSRLPPRQARPARRPARRPVVLRVLAVVFFFVPLALAVAGQRSAPIENRPLAKAPDWRMSWDVVDELSAYVTDRLPLRDRAIRLNAEVSEQVFGEPPAIGGPAPTGVGGVFAPPTGDTPAQALAGEGPAPEQELEKDFLTLPPAKPEPVQATTGGVLGGKDGWLYLSAELVKECNRGQPPARVVQGLARLQRVLAASGRGFVFTLAPDKSTAVPQHLPASFPNSACAARSKAETYALLDAAAIPGYVDMHGLIATHQAAENRPYYLRKDTHWNTLATSLLAKEVAARLDPRLLDGLRLEEAIVPYTGDLTTLLGNPTSDDTLAAAVVRPGVSTTSKTNVTLTSGVTGTRTLTASTGPPLVGGQTLLVGDSFAEAGDASLSPLFANLLRMRNGDVLRAPRTAVTTIQASRTVVLVWSERYFTDPAYGVLWSTPFLDKLEASLNAPP